MLTRALGRHRRAASRAWRTWPGEWSRWGSCGRKRSMRPATSRRSSQEGEDEGEGPGIDAIDVDDIAAPIEDCHGTVLRASERRGDQRCATWQHGNDRGAVKESEKKRP